MAGLRQKTIEEMAAESAGGHRYPEHLARWDQPSPEVAPPASAPLQEGLRAPVALNLPAGPTPQLAPGARLPTFGQTAIDPEQVPEDPPPSEAQGQAAPAAVPSVPGVGSKTVTQESRIVRSPEEIAAAKAETKANREHVEAVKAQQKSESQAAMADAEAEQARAAQQQEILADQQRQMESAELDRRAKETIAAQEIKSAEDAVKFEAAESQKTPFSGNLGAALFRAFVVGASTKQAFTMGKDPSEMPAIKEIDAIMQRDKQARMAKLAQSKEFLAEKRKGPEYAKQAWLDAVDRIEIQAAQRLKVALSAAESLKANAKVDKARFDANGQIVVAKAEADAAAAAGRLAQRGSVQRTTETTRVPRTSADSASMVRWQGKDYGLSDKVDARKLRQKAGATESLVGQLDTLSGLIEQYKATPLTMGDERAEIEAAIGRITGGIKESQELGALDSGVQKLVASMISDPTKIKTWIFKGGAQGSIKSIQALKAEAVKSMENSLSADPSSGFQREPGAGTSPLSSKTPAQLDAALRKALTDPKFKHLVPQLQDELRRRKAAGGN